MKEAGKGCALHQHRAIDRFVCTGDLLYGGGAPLLQLKAVQ